MPDNFDYAILGGGAAGLSLALALTRSPLQEKSILIVEKDDKRSNDRTWCFWTDQPTPYDGIARRFWPRLSFISDTVERTWDLSPFRYVMVRGVDFFNFARAELQKHNVTFVRGEGEVSDDPERARVTVNQPTGKVATFDALYAFDSRIRSGDVILKPKYNYLKQHFLGWEVETAHPVFDPQTVTMFDLRTPQRGGITFFYVLPFSPTSALVEYTLFSPGVLPIEDYASALRGYLSEMGAGETRILETERGVIPMTDAPFPRRLGQRILSIGTRGGRVKPSTGYAFARIQRDSTRIVDSLTRFSHPFAIPPDPLRFRLQDSILLELLAKEPDLGRPVFSAIFSKNPVQRVLKFLDNRSSLLEDLQIMGSHAPWPFLRAIRRRFLVGDSMGAKWMITPGIVVEGHRVASQPSPEYPYATLEKQIPLFTARGLDLGSFFHGTLNISIAPKQWEMLQPEFTFRGIAWTDLHPPEDFSFSACRVRIGGLKYPGWVYYPHPETKIRHFQNPSLIEVITEHIPGIGYGTCLELEVRTGEIRIY
jgi:lycopene beta-cyclase